MMGDHLIEECLGKQKKPLDAEELQELTLTPTVNITSSSDFGIYLLYQKQRYLVPKVKAAVDFLVARIKQIHAWVGLSKRAAV